MARISAADAMDCAKWFIKNSCDSPRNSYKGNMKLQKLLYFAQLIHLAKFNTLLFNEPILAFKNGSVVEKVRLSYQNHHDEIIAEANAYREIFNKDQLTTLQLTVEIFGDASPEELSELNHFHRGWEKAFERSKSPDNFYLKELSVISIDDIKKYDLENIRQMLDAYALSEQSMHSFTEINGIIFYYDPNELELTPEILQELKQFNGDESSYNIYMDESAGLVIF
ncbi:MAG: DUF4065 domain-containing protein [Syntrophomonadaceae bacterium]|nr:DUF4065 domain-containing protein [Syntrophomonadaceae bacterium]MDD4550022.1 DUF4065 domain-containing protein [Syntrophomonadaceae bacterium]